MIDGLNPSQAEAVLHGDGPLLIVAGAGSGKTRVLTQRIAYLISERGVSPFEILAITFTNKAAEEMRSRVAQLVGPVASRMWVSTFHSACARILRREAPRLGYPSNFSIYDQADARRLIGYVLRDLEIDPKRITPRSVAAQISLAKNQMRSPDDLAASASHIIERKVAEVYAEYQTRLLRAGAMDFDDLLAVTVRIFVEMPDVADAYRHRFRYILVDEYQDTNRVQNELVFQLAGKHRNVAVVGDGDQSIYQFRGADLSNILDFERTFPDATTVVLDQNYRSTQSILDAANAVISHNQARTPKHLWTDQGAGDAIIRYCGDDERDEAQWIAHEIARLRDTRRYAYGDVAVFYRANAQSRVLEEALFRTGVPYKVIGGVKFYDRKEVKDILAYVRSVVNPTDEVSLKRVINEPKRGVGDTTVGRLDAWALDRQVSFREALAHAEEAGVTGKARKGIVDFVEILDDVAGAVDDGPARLIERIMERSGYLAELEAEHTIEAEGRIENLTELVGFAEEFETIDAMLEQISLVADADDLPVEEGDDAEAAASGKSEVLLMTMHAAKGLEFPVVFVTGLEEGIFPHMRSIGDPNAIEEERRLAYVGITRARERLYLTQAWGRTLHGMTNYNPPSRFVAEIPAELLTEAPGSRTMLGTRAGSGGWGDRSSGSSYGTGSSFGSGRRDRYDSYDSDEGSGGGRSSSVSSFDPDEPEGYVPRRSARSERATGNRLDLPASRIPAKPTVASAAGLKAGDDVRHPTFGDGVIISIRGEGDRAEALVNFVSAGEKHLLLAWAPLEKVS